MNAPVAVPQPGLQRTVRRRRAWLLTSRRRRLLVMLAGEASSSLRRQGGLRNRAALAWILEQQRGCLAHIAAALMGRSRALRASDKQLRETLEHAFRCRRLLLIPVRAPELSSGEHTSLFQASDDTAPPQRESQPPALHWIEFELVDDLGKPAPGHAYEAVAPDGEVIRGRLNSQGFARVSLAAPGVCQITFPELDESSWSPASTE